MKKLIILFIAVITFFGCSEVTKIIEKESPHQQYEEMLHETGLLETELGKAWLNASKKALEDTLQIDIPYSEQAYFFDDRAAAFAYIFTAAQGEKVKVNIQKDSSNIYKIFIDLFRLDGQPVLEAFADGDETSLEFEAEENTRLLVRIQPELLKGGNFSIRIEKTATLAFPVSNKDSRAIASIWGDVRDGGKRKHEGVDIFAPKRTPVTAAADGFITKTGSNRLGGKVVWLFTGSKSLYYAHLDSQLVVPGMYVKTGDTLGLVGNTGNAITTPPHLHFGIYSEEGAVDPYPFIRNVFPEPEKLRVNNSYIADWGRIKTTYAIMRAAPSVSSRTIKRLKKNTPFIVYGGSGSWYKVKLPDGSSGYLQGASVEKAEKPLSSLTISSGDSIEIKTGNSIVYISRTKQGNLPVYGVYDNLNLISFNGSYMMARKI